MIGSFSWLWCLFVFFVVRILPPDSTDGTDGIDGTGNPAIDPDTGSRHGSVRRPRLIHTKKEPGSLLQEPGIYLATTYSHKTYRLTTIGAAAFHFRVRNGTGWFHRALVTRGQSWTGLSLGQSKLNL